MFILIATFLYGGKLFLKLLKKSDITANRSYTIQDLSNLENSAYFSENSPSVAFDFYNLGNNSVDDLISITAKHYQSYNNNGVVKMNITDLEIKNCTDELFPGHSNFEMFSSRKYK